MSGSTLLERLIDGHPLALSRAITAVENDDPTCATLLQGIAPHLGKAKVLGVTGAPGAGKSTLTSALIGEFRRRGMTVGVIAVDPSSPLTGGAILGDRIRMNAHIEDPHVFIRSLAARGHLGGLCVAASRVIDVMDAAGKDIVIVETVGAGQSEVEVADLADVKLVVCAPGLGDEIQAIKAGILEIADILVVNKADLPGARHTVNQLNGMLGLRAGNSSEVPVIETVATTPAGIADLALAILDKFSVPGMDHRPPRSEGFARRLIAEAAAEQLRRQILASDSEMLKALCREVSSGACSASQAAARCISQPGKLEI